MGGNTKLQVLDKNKRLLMWDDCELLPLFDEAKGQLHIPNHHFFDIDAIGFVSIKGRVYEVWDVREGDTNSDDEHIPLTIYFKAVS
ncbi:MAG: hypothetical protein HQK86_03145 [Nitrospinae bacterium]|nr:hypothetical protein [Nitrospinota bacterium]